MHVTLKKENRRKTRACEKLKNCVVQHIYTLSPSISSIDSRWCAHKSLQQSDCRIWPCFLTISEYFFSISAPEDLKCDVIVFDYVPTKSCQRHEENLLISITSVCFLSFLSDIGSVSKQHQQRGNWNRRSVASCHGGHDWWFQSSSTHPRDDTNRLQRYHTTDTIRWTFRTSQHSCYKWTDRDGKHKAPGCSKIRWRHNALRSKLHESFESSPSY